MRVPLVLFLLRCGTRTVCSLYSLLIFVLFAPFPTKFGNLKDCEEFNVSGFLLGEDLFGGKQIKGNETFG